MTVFPFLAVSFIMKIVAVLFSVCAVALILIILVQKGKGGGLSAAFGGGAAGGILGSKTGDFLTWVTIVLVGVFLTLAVVMAKFYKPSLGTTGEGTPPRTVSPTGPPRSPELPSPLDESGNENIDINLPGTG
jgi:preprotein translocase subunit SecG